MTTYITVTSHTSPWEAHITKGLLESEGITVQLANEHVVWADWSFSNAVGGVQVQVAETDVVRAQAILQTLEDGAYETALKAEQPAIEDNQCPQCQSKDFDSHFPNHLLLLVAMTLGICGVIFPLRKELHQCRFCGLKWKS